MAKVKKVWARTTYEVEIGSTEYEVTAQPLRRVMELEDAIRKLAGGNWLSTPDEIPEDGAEEDAEETAVPTFQFNWPQLKERLVGVGYEPLKIAIPELEEEDFLDAPLPQLEQVFNVVLDANGLSLLRSWVKNLLEPLGGAAKKALMGVIADFLEARISPTVTPSTES